LLVVQPALGAAAVLASFPLALPIAHNAGAALLLVALLTATRALYAEDLHP
jgi:heme A synthase